MSGPSRRRFMKQTMAGGSLLALSDTPLFSGLRPVSAEEAQVDPQMVQFQPEIEPLVRMLEETPRDKVIEEVARRVQKGLSYRALLAALQLAGVRNVQPRPSVGFKFHAVLVVNSAHLASLSSPDSDRWLPIFWAIDSFKGAQARDVQEGNWTMGPVDESHIPPAHRAEAALREAMDNWDVEAADAAVAGLARTAGADRVFELFAHYGARDFRSIGHKAIFVANGFRTLQCIGWRYSEPILRSLAYALLNHEGEPNPATSDLDPDRPWRQNQELAASMRDKWLEGQQDDQTVQRLLVSLRTASPHDAAAEVTELINAGVSPQSVFDAYFLTAGELLMRQPAIVALHASTTTNAIRYAFETTSDDQTRRLLLLQNAAFLTLFRDAMKSRGEVGDAEVDHLTPETTQAENAIEGAFKQLSHDRMAAARQVYGLLEEGTRAEDVIRAARQLIFLKGNDSHDYKFSSAVMEDFYNVSPTWRNRFLAASSFKLRGADEPNNGLIDRIRDALA